MKPGEEKSVLARLIPVTRGRGPATAPPGLLEACRRGDRDAFRALYEAYRDDVYSIALNFTADAETANDVTQDVFVKLFTAIASFREESSFRTWLFRMVANSCRDAHRRSRRFVPMPEDVRETVEDSRSPDADARERELSRQVRSAVAALAPKLRLPILLRYVEGLSYAEIGDALRCSPGTVASRLNRGHRILAERLRSLRGSV
ncbi:MAG TPA: sigma-70 family RNA polymerase sigma factor [Thermoanaerobaculia bacterium]|nr:sigma-70 family RNA polymerase sigma factor [Thermoanaerobaculia bacterium]